jgi:hypothetical protein
MEQQPGRPSKTRRALRFILFLMAAAALGLLFIDDLRPAAEEPPAARLLPDLVDYRQVEGQTITAYVGALGEGAALLAGQPQLALTVGVVDGIAGCYQEVGGVRARVYSHAERPLEAGVVAVVDQARLTDPENLFRCVTPTALELEGLGETVIEPCTAAFTLTRPEGVFHVIYAASTYATCRDFCAALEGCAVHVDVGPLGKWTGLTRFTRLRNPTQIL